MAAISLLLVRSLGGGVDGDTLEGRAVLDHVVNEDHAVLGHIAQVRASGGRENGGHDVLEGCAVLDLFVHEDHAVVGHRAQVRASADGKMAAMLFMKTTLSLATLPRSEPRETGNWRP